MVNIFGASGYVGSRYCKLYHSIPQPRNDLRPLGPRVLYMISTTHNYHLATNPWIDIDTNITHLIRVLEQCKQVPDMEFNFVSSWFVYGATTEPCNEQHVCNPQGFYSVTKRTAEQLLIEYCQHHGIAWRILRLCNVIGGVDNSASLHKNVFHALMRNIRCHQPITMVNQGKFRRDYLHRDDVCHAINHVINHGNINTIYNIGSGHPIFFRDAIEFAIAQTNSRSEILDQTRDNMLDCVMDCTKLHRLGWCATQSWQSAVLDVIQYA